MTDVARDREAGAEGDGSRGSYELPRRLTASGRGAMDKAVHDLVAELTANMDRHTHYASDLTDRDVETALHALGRGRLRSVPPPTGTRTAGQANALGPALATVGQVGTTVSAAFLHSVLQIVVFAALVLIGLTGLTMTWVQARRRAGDS